MSPARAAHWAAILPLGGLAAIASLGALLTIHGLRGEGLLSPELASVVLRLHVAVGGASLGAVAALVWLPRVAQRCTSWPRLAVLVLGLALVVIAAPLTAALAGPEVGAYVTHEPSLLLSALGFAMVGGAGVGRDLASVVLAVLAGLWLAVGLAAAWPTDGVLLVTFHPPLLALLVVLAIATALEPLVAPGRRWALALGLLVLALGPLASWAGFPLRWMLRAAVAGAALLLGLTGVAARARAELPLGARAALVLATLGAAIAAALDAALGGEADVMVHDTLAPVGLAHVQLTAIACATLATMRAPWRSPRLSGAGLASFTLGGAALSFALIGLGLEGMPTRYVRWEGDGEPLRIVAAIGASLALLGAALLTSAAVLAPADPPPQPAS